MRASRKTSISCRACCQATSRSSSCRPVSITTRERRRQGPASVNATRERASVLASAGFLASWAGDVDGSIAECLEAISIATKLGEPAIIARGYLHVNLALTFLGEHEKEKWPSREAEVAYRTSCRNACFLANPITVDVHLTTLIELPVALAYSSAG